VVIVWGNDIDVDTAMKEIAIRAKDATIGVPSETRQALKDGTTGFERILPGPERMYPDTDLPPKRIAEDRIAKIKSQLPEYYWDRVRWYNELGLPQDCIVPLAISKLAPLFKRAVNELKINPILVSVVLIQYPKRLRKMGVEFETIEENIYEGIFRAYKQGLVSKEGILPALYDAVKYGVFDLDNMPPPIDENDINTIISNSLTEVRIKNLRDVNNFEEVYKGIVMNKVRGRIDGTLVTKSVTKYVKGIK
jgi:glutamyl-tRNA(Gln) amidotransferase subunit E